MVVGGDVVAGGGVVVGGGVAGGGVVGGGGGDDEGVVPVVPAVCDTGAVEVGMESTDNAVWKATVRSATASLNLLSMYSVKLSSNLLTITSSDTAKDSFSSNTSSSRVETPWEHNNWVSSWLFSKLSTTVERLSSMDARISALSWSGESAVKPKRLPPGQLSSSLLSWAPTAAVSTATSTTTTSTARLNLNIPDSQLTYRARLSNLN